MRRGTAATTLPTVASSSSAGITTASFAPSERSGNSIVVMGACLAEAAAAARGVTLLLGLPGLRVGDLRDLRDLAGRAHDLAAALDGPDDVPLAVLDEGGRDGRRLAALHRGDGLHDAVVADDLRRLRRLARRRRSGRVASGR